MKYCSKCGKELFDEAVICPGCGCPVESGNNSSKDVHLSKMKTALILNIFAFVIAVCSGFVYSGLTVDSFGDALHEFLTDPIVYRLVALVTLSFVICMVNMILFKKKRTRTALIWVYILSVAITVAYFAIFAPLYFFTTICGSGMLFPIPPILQVIAALKLVQATE